MTEPRRNWLAMIFIELLSQIRRVLLFLFSLGFAGAIIVGVFILILLPALPDIGANEHTSLKVPLRIYSSEGTLLGEFGDEKRDPIEIETVPPLLIKAILAAEDNQFYEHIGIDMSGIARAIIANLRSGGVRQGASTITMQVARNYFLTPEQTYIRKVKEILLAFKLEHRFDKDQILELYINKIFLGHRAYGFSTAALTYYGKDLKELGLAPLAMLAALPKAPSRNNPITNPDYARTRRDYVLDRMLELGYIDVASHSAASESQLSAALRGPALMQAPYIAEMARRYMVEKYGQQAYGEGYRVFTTVSAPLQMAARQALRNGLKDYDKRHGYRGPIGNISISDQDLETATGQERTEIEKEWREQLANHTSVGALRPALVTRVKELGAEGFTVDGKRIELPWSGMEWAQRYLDADTMDPKPLGAGEVLQPGHVVYVRQNDSGEWVLDQVPEATGALISINANDGAIQSVIGGYDYALTKFNRAIQAKRQPGSNIKPFIYSAAFEKGFTAATAVSGGPIVVEHDDLGNVWRPQNYTGRFSGPTPLRRALSRSLNLVSVRLLRAVTPEFGAKYLRRFGFKSEDMPVGLPLALGAASFTPLEVARGYGVFANGGYLVEPYFISRVEDRNHNIVERANPAQACDYCNPPTSDLNSATAIAATATEAQQTSTRRLAPRVISSANAFILNDLLREVVRSGTGYRVRNLKRDDLGGKTGTTDEFYDAWFSGFNRDVVTTVWVGFDQSQTLGMGESGGRTALPSWLEYMDVAMRGQPEKVLTPPDSVVQAWTDKNTGDAAVADDHNSFFEYFIFGTEPAQVITDSESGDADSPPQKEQEEDVSLF